MMRVALIRRASTHSSTPRSSPAFYSQKSQELQGSPLPPHYIKTQGEGGKHKQKGTKNQDTETEARSMGRQTVRQNRRSKLNGTKEEGRGRGRDTGGGEGAAQGRALGITVKKQRTRLGSSWGNGREKGMREQRGKKSREHRTRKCPQDACAWGRIPFVVTLMLWARIRSLDSEGSRMCHILLSPYVSLTLLMLKFGS